MWVIAAVLLAFILPVLLLFGKEWSSARYKEEPARRGLHKPPAKERFSAAVFARVLAVILVLTAPVLYLSTLSYSFYSPDESAIKLAFKMVGKRIVDCDEAKFLQEEGERYRKLLNKEHHGVKMNIEKLTNCPRERHPVVVRMTLDGKDILDKAYAPTGIKKDMSSYVYEEFLIKPGEHKVQVGLSDMGKDSKPEYTLETSFDLKPREIKLIRFDDTLGKLVIE